MIYSTYAIGVVAVRFICQDMLNPRKNSSRTLRNSLFTKCPSKWLKLTSSIASRWFNSLRCAWNILFSADWVFFLSHSTKCWTTFFEIAHRPRRSTPDLPCVCPFLPLVLSINCPTAFILEGCWSVYSKISLIRMI